MRILLIEDDPKLSGSIAKHLRAESFAVDIAANGKKGEELATHRAYRNEEEIVLSKLSSRTPSCLESRSRDLRS